VGEVRLGASTRLVDCQYWFSVLATVLLETLISSLNQFH